MLLEKLMTPNGRIRSADHAVLCIRCADDIDVRGVAWLRLNRCGCIPRIAKVVDPLDIAHVRAGVHASGCGQASLPSSGQLAIAD